MASKDHPEVGVLEQSAAPMFDPTRDTFLSSVDAVVSREDYPDEDSFQMAQSQWEALALHNLNEQPNSVDSSSIDRFRQYLVQLYGDTDTGQCSMLQNIPKASLFLGGKPAPSNFDQAHFLLKFMRAGGHNADMALSNLRQFLKLAKNSPSYYKWVGNLEVLRKVMKEEIFYSLAHRDKFGRRVNIVRCGQWDPTRASFQECFSTAHSLLELCSLDQRTQISGVTAIFDCKDFGFKQFRNVSIDNVRVTATAHQEALPVWVRQIHVINYSLLINTCYNIVYPFMNERSKELVIFHSNLTSLHKYLDPEMLPSEYGGSQGPLDSSEEALALEAIHSYLQQVNEYVMQDHKV